MSRRLAARRRGRPDPELRRNVEGALSRVELRLLEPEVTVDAMGAFCPEPVIRTQNRMPEVSPGGVLELHADDAGVEVDIPAWCISTGNEYLGLLKEEGRHRVFVRRKA